MYCSSCGVAVAQGLSYCNYCGAKLNEKGDSGSSPYVKPELLVSAMVGLFILGLAAITVLLGVMKAVLQLSGPQIIPFALLSFLLLLVLEGIIIRLLLSGKRAAKAESNPPISKEHATKELDPPPARTLSEPVPSVTEHTTRALDPVYNERTSK